MLGESGNLGTNETDNETFRNSLAFTVICGQCGGAFYASYFEFWLQIR